MFWHKLWCPIEHYLLGCPRNASKNSDKRHPTIPIHPSDTVLLPNVRITSSGNRIRISLACWSHVEKKCSARVVVIPLIRLWSLYNPANVTSAVKDKIQVCHRQIVSGCESIQQLIKGNCRSVGSSTSLCEDVSAFCLFKQSLNELVVTQHSHLQLELVIKHHNFQKSRWKKGEQCASIA